MDLFKTSLFETHKSLGAKFAPFAGYEMPINYSEGIIAEHSAVRNSAGFFDVSHMGQLEVTGKNAAKFFSLVTPSDFENSVEINQCKYTVLTNEKGGIIDDLIITKLASDKFYVVVNASRKQIDVDHMNLHKPADVTIKILEKALVALQGPLAETILKEKFAISGIENLGYMKCGIFNIQDLGEVFITRTGYTGEDGVELSLTADQANIFCKKLVEFGAKPAGLGARDVLRLEMGYPLYGSDIDEETSPIEAGLSWVITKGHSHYIGYNKVKELQNGYANKKRVGLKIKDKIVARHGAEIYKDGNKIGVVTSGGFSPILSQPIAMGYVEVTFAGIGNEVEVDVRGKKYAAEITKMPFVKASTKK